MKRARLHRRGILSAGVQIWLLLLCVIYRRHIKFPPAALEHIWVTLLIFSLALITGEQTFNACTRRATTPPSTPLQLRDRGGYQNARKKPGFPGSLSQLGVEETRKPEIMQKCGASLSRGARGDTGIGIESVFFFLNIFLSAYVGIWDQAEWLN